MSNLYKVIYSLCEKKEITPGRLCNDLHISRSMLTDLKSGRKETLSTKTLAKIADYFGVTTDYLLTGEKLNIIRDCYEDEDIRRIERARNNMSTSDKKKMMNILKSAFDEYFDKDYQDEDKDE